MSLREFISGVRRLRRFTEALEAAPAELGSTTEVIDMREIAPGVFVPRQRKPVQVPSRALVELERELGTWRKVRKQFRAMQREANANRSRKR